MPCLGLEVGTARSDGQVCYDDRRVPAVQADGADDQGIVVHAAAVHAAADRRAAAVAGPRLLPRRPFHPVLLHLPECAPRPNPRFSGPALCLGEQAGSRLRPGPSVLGVPVPRPAMRGTSLHFHCGEINLFR